MPWDEPTTTGDLLHKLGQISRLTDHEVGIGDDSAIVHWSPNNLVACSDVIVEEVHFSLRYFSYSDVGYKAISTNISDLAAMGATPGFVLVTIACPHDGDMDAIFSGISTACSQYETQLIGGDLSDASRLTISVCAIGYLDNAKSALRRDRAQAGQSIFVTGLLGRSSHALRQLQDSLRPDSLLIDDLNAHLRPQARPQEGLQALRSGASGGIDISDGLALDLHRIADASNLGFELESLPVAPGATNEDALFGGEDYELILTTSQPEKLINDFQGAGLRRPHYLGVMVTDPSVRTLRSTPLPKIGYFHELP
jgi:thiamine-monophosphate kinase